MVDFSIQRPVDFVGELGRGMAIGQQRKDRKKEEEMRLVAERLQTKMADPNFDLLSSNDFGVLQANRPDLAKGAMDRFSAMSNKRQQEYVQDMVKAKGFLEMGDVQGSLGFLSDRASTILKRGGQPDDTLRLMNIIQQNPNYALQGLNDMVRARTGYETQHAGGKREPLQYKDGGLVFDPNTGRIAVNPVAVERLNQIAEQKSQGGSLSVSDKRSINGDITKMLKDTTLIHRTAKDLEILQKNPSGPASIATVFKFMKALDPTSVVREGEFATAENSAGVPEAVRNMYNKLASGERLGDNQIQSFVSTARNLANSAIDSSSTEINGYLSTFDSDLPESFSKKIRGRIPQKFDIQQQENDPLGIL